MEFYDNSTLNELFDIDWQKKLILLKKGKDGALPDSLNTQQLHNWSMQITATEEGIRHELPFAGCGFLGLQPVIKIINGYQILLPSVSKFTVYGYITTQNPGKQIFITNGSNAEITMIRHSRPYIKLFISYSSKEKEFARDLNNKLSVIAETFFDEIDIHPGDSVTNRLNQELNETNMLILIVSINSMNSEWVQKEWAAMLHLKKKIIPIILERTEIPPLLRDISYIKYENNMVDLVNKLAEAF